MLHLGQFEHRFDHRTPYMYGGDYATPVVSTYCRRCRTRYRLWVCDRMLCMVVVVSSGSHLGTRVRTFSNVNMIQASRGQLTSPVYAYTWVRTSLVQPIT